MWKMGKPRSVTLLTVVSAVMEQEVNVELVEWRLYSRRFPSPPFKAYRNSALANLRLAKRYSHLPFCVGSIETRLVMVSLSYLHTLNTTVLVLLSLSFFEKPNAKIFI